MQKHYVQEITKDFQVGMNCKTESSKIIQLGFIDKGTGKHESNIVYSGGGYKSYDNGKFRSETTAHDGCGKRLINVGNLGVGGERGDVFLPTGICPCQSATQYKDAIKVVIYDNDKCL